MKRQPEMKLPAQVTWQIQATLQIQGKPLVRGKLLMQAELQVQLRAGYAAECMLCHRFASDQPDGKW